MKKFIHKRWKLALVIAVLILLYVFYRITSNQTNITNNITPVEINNKQIIPTITEVQKKYTLIESHRGTPRLVSMEGGENLLAGNEYYDILKQRIEKDNLSAKIWFESKCNEFWIFNKLNDEFVSIQRHGYHSDGCPGDPNFAPRLDSFNINRKTKEIFWLNIGQNKNIPYKDWAKTISKE